MLLSRHTSGSHGPPERPTTSYSGSGSSSTPGSFTRPGTFSLLIHELSFSPEELVLNPEHFPSIALHDVVEIIPYGGGRHHGQQGNDSTNQDQDNGSKSEPPSLFLQVTSLAPVRASRMQISILKPVAEVFSLQAFQEVTVRKADPKEALAEFVEFTFKDDFISRADMWRFKTATYGRCAHVGQNFNLAGVRARVKDLTRGGKTVLSGVLQDSTKMTFRSRSTRIFWLVQMSCEMWDFAPDGEIYYEKFLTFAKNVLDQWRALDVSHSLSVVFFARMYYYQPSPSQQQQQQQNGNGGGGRSGSGCDMSSGLGKGVNVDGEGRMYQDFYKMVLDNETKNDHPLEKVMWMLKKEYLDFPRVLTWRIPLFGDRVAYGLPSKASTGNFLEAINVTLNVLEKHYMDRDLLRTGNSIVTISPSTGVIEVDSNLSGITKQRMMDNGIGMDMVSLSQPPMHTVPLFIYRDKPSKVGHHGPYEVPHWMHISYVQGRTKEGPNLTSLEGGGLGGGGPEVVEDDDEDEEVFHPLPFSHMLNIDLEDSPDVSCVPFSPALSLSPSRQKARRDITLPTSLITAIDGISEAGAGAGDSPSTEDGTEGGPPSSTTGATEEEEEEELGRSVSLLTAAVQARKCSSAINSEDGEGGPPTCDIYPNRLPSLLGDDMEEDPMPPPLDLGEAEDEEPPPGMPIAESFREDTPPPLALALPNKKSSMSTPTTAVQQSLRRRLLDHDATLFHIKAPSRSKTDPGFYRTSSMVEFDVMPDASSSPISPPLVMLSTKSEGGMRMIPYQGPNPSTSPKVTTPVALSSGGNPSPSLPIPDRTNRAFAPKRSKPFRRPISHEGSKELVVKPASASSSISGGGAVVSRSAGGMGGGNPSRQGLSGHYRVSFSEHGSSGPTRAGSGSFRRLESEASLMSDMSDVNTLGLSRSLEDGEEGGGASGVGIRIPIVASNGELHHHHHHHHVGSAGSHYRGYQNTEAFSPKTPPQGLQPDALQRIQSVNALSMSRHSSLLKSSLPVPQARRAGSIPNMRREGDAGSLPNRKKGGGAGAGGGGGSIANVPSYGSMSAYSVGSMEMVPGSSSMGSGGGMGATAVLLRSRKVINPFRRQDEAEILKQRTHNHRRWSHVFPPGEVEFKHSPGPSWKSLCQPAILPLTTDYVPLPEQIRRDYTESFYTLTLPDMDDHGPSSVKTYKSHKELLDEMVCQRLQQDFQLVEKTTVNLSTSKRTPRTSIVHTLSMGHRIHVLTYDELTRQVDVKRYLDRQGSNASPSNNYHYAYFLWVPQYHKFQAVSQSFTKYPTPEYNWNNVDELICGYFDELRPATKYRRKLFAVCPEEFASPDEVASYMARMEKLVDFLNSRRSKGGNSIEVEVATGFYAASPEGRQSHARDVMNMPARGPIKTTYIHIPISGGPGSSHHHTPSNPSLANTGTGASIPPLPPTTSSSSSASSSLTAPGTNQASSSNSFSRYEWINLVCDSVVSPCRVFHLEIHWLVCSARNVREFVQTLQRKGQQLNLNLIAIPEYSRSGNLQIHPFIAHPYIVLPSPTVCRLAEEALLTRLDFVPDDERPTDWRELGLGSMMEGGCGGSTIHESALTSSLGAGRPISRTLSQKASCARQYCHRSGGAFCRVGPTGVAWIHNRLKEREGIPEVEARFGAICQDLSMCYQLVEEIISGVLK